MKEKVKIVGEMIVRGIKAGLGVKSPSQKEFGKGSYDAAALKVWVAKMAHELNLQEMK